MKKVFISALVIIGLVVVSGSFIMVSGAEPAKTNYRKSSPKVTPGLKRFLAGAAVFTISMIIIRRRKNERGYHDHD